MHALVIRVKPRRRRIGGVELLAQRIGRGRSVEALVQEHGRSGTASSNSFSVGNNADPQVRVRRANGSTRFALSMRRSPATEDSCSATSWLCWLVRMGAFASLNACSWRIASRAAKRLKSMAPTFAACSTPRFMVNAPRDISVPIRSAVRGAPVDGEPSDSGDRRNQDGAACACVTPIRGAPDRDDAARIPRPGAVLECPRS